MVEFSSIREVVGKRVWDPIVKQTTLLASDYKVVQVAVAVFVLVSLASVYVYWRCANFYTAFMVTQFYNKMRARFGRTSQIPPPVSNQICSFEQILKKSVEPLPTQLETVIEEV
jgi:hypothetical protein